jgi:hypothetical protein
MLRALVRWFTLPSDALSYEAAAHRMRTFDVVYFFSLARPMNYVIWLFGGKPVTHVGMAVVDPRNGEVYILESVSHVDRTPDALCTENCLRTAPCGSHRVFHNGVRLVSLRQRMLDTSSQAWLVWVQPLHVTETVRTQCAARLSDFLASTHAAHYEQRPACMLLAPLNAPPGCGPGEDTSSYYCSELVAAAYRHCGLSAVENASNVWHSAFLDREPGLRLQLGAHLDDGGFYVGIPATVSSLPPPPPPSQPPPPPPPQPLAAKDIGSLLVPDDDINDDDDDDDKEALQQPIVVRKHSELLRRAMTNGVRFPY